jgi:hypothetical protein
VPGRARAGADSAQPRDHGGDRTLSYDDGLSASRSLPLPQDTGRAVAGDGAEPSRGAAQGPPVAPGVADLETLAADLVRRFGIGRARFVAALLEEAAAAAEDAA